VSLKTLTQAASRGVSRQIFSVKQHSPVLLFGVGAIGFVSTCVLSVRATLNLSDVLEEAEKDLEKIDETVKVTQGGEDVTEEVKQKAKLSVKLQTSIRIAKHYALPAAVGVASIAALTGSHIILTKRNTGLVAAYATLDSMYKQYRARVVEDQGTEKDREYRFGVVEKAIVDPETGAVEMARGIDADAVRKNGESDYARMFDKYHEHWEPSYKQNIFYLNSVIQWLEMRLQHNGFVFLNEMYEYMGYEPTQAGSQVGWVKDAHLVKEGDGYISFGLEKNTENAVNFMNGTRHDVILDPNVDGVIVHKLRRI
jgi:hypothetical protein